MVEKPVTDCLLWCNQVVTVYPNGSTRLRATGHPKFFGPYLPGNARSPLGELSDGTMVEPMANRSGPPRCHGAIAYSGWSKAANGSNGSRWNQKFTAFFSADQERFMVGSSCWLDGNGNKENTDHGKT